MLGQSWQTSHWEYEWAGSNQFNYLLKDILIVNEYIQQFKIRLDDFDAFYKFLNVYEDLWHVTKYLSTHH